MERWWFYLAVLSLGVGGFFAFLVAMARTPGVEHLFPPGYFYHALTGHVDLAIVVFLLSFTMLLWNQYYPKEEKVTFPLASLGAVLIGMSSLLGLGLPVSNNYLPTLVHPLFFTGAGLFFTAFWLSAFLRLKEAIADFRSDDPKRSSLSTSVILSLLMLVAFVFSSLRAGDPAEVYRFYERLYWAPGHIHQFINGSVLIHTWYRLLYLTGKGVRSSRLWMSFVPFLLFGVLLTSVPLVFSDPISRDAIVFTEISYAVGLGIPIFFHMFYVVRNLRPLSFTHLYPTALFISLLLYFLGVIIAYGGIKADLRVPAHYHGAVTSLTLALMTLSYHLMQEWGILRRISRSFSLTQVYLYGVGMVLFILGLYLAGLKGAPRKTYGTAYTQDPFVLGALLLMGLGTLLAVIGGVMFVLYVLKSTLSHARFSYNQR
ncbi:conserved hypothetical protein [Thermocrinis albus DSM 14484]|uniref:Cytochrome c oxidase subunit I n=1 Tax=Thermocrinis albus (strain DSM 14484 / JCM 11386 / HI 11/12) TaxID=638303 RepID=D3SMX9_THEAH|nr:cbb3-type cytochrome c oxidase subunit I [Thermocrinis albus]ADC90109.1 conserved hypothetical protein [Thermocrinis albus DSM 14484]